MQSEMEGLLTVGRALWVDPERRGRQWIETHAAVMLQGGEESEQVERMAQALLERARRGSRDPMAAWDRPFFRLETDERLVLSALHGPRRWSYERLGRVLWLPMEGVEQLAWRARMRLASHLKRVDGTVIPYPTGSARATASCPEFLPDRPWTQRFLDEELTNKNEQLFFQNHLMACSQCQNALSRCRDLYYAVDAAVNEALLPTPLDEVLREQASRDRVWLKPATQRTFLESLSIFTRRDDVRWVGIGLILLMGSKIVSLIAH